MQASIQAFEARVAALEGTVQSLLERVQQDSRTSSRPPSSDPPERPRRQRPWLWVAVTQVVTVFLGRCGKEPAPSLLLTSHES